MSYKVPILKPKVFWNFNEVKQYVFGLHKT